MSDMEASSTTGTAAATFAGQTEQINSSNKENSAEQRTTRQQMAPNQSKRPTSGASVLSMSAIGCNVTNQAAGDRKQHRLKSRFTVIKKLGKGTYGKVQLAINKETGQEVAIKTIKKTKIENEQDLQRVRREIQIMSSIEHPHIIHIYEVFENKDKIVLIMQYAPGGELYEYVSQSRALDDCEARRLFRQIATAIYYCHQNKICHRDLKLENILLDEKNNAKIADFGLSNVFDKRRQLATFCGSPLYASPEIVQGSPYEGPEVDCWSLGVLLYTLVYGAMPFDGSNFKRLVKQISEATYYEPKQRSQASGLINRLLCADPSQRATILDICSDPWVNGAPSSPSNRGSSSSSPGNIQPHHPSLLKVAQDMANLTPVRVDILLALTRPPAPEVAAATSLASGNREAPRPAETPKQSNRPNRHKPTIELDASLMEVDEIRSTSPVANYIVRDLDSEPTSDKAVAESEHDAGPNAATAGSEQQQGEPVEETQQVSDSTTTFQEQQIPANERPDIRIEPEESQPEDVEQASSMQVEPQTDLEGAKMDEEAVRTDDNATKAGETNTQLDREKVGDGKSMEVDEKQHQETMADTTKPMEEMAEAATSEEAKEQEEPRAADSLMQESPAEPAKEREQKEGELKEENEEKPKKKKKIVIVKKKRKVVKREADQTSDKNVGDDKTISSKQQDEQQAAKTAPSSKGPVGRVRIPETFQPGEEPEQREPLQKASDTSRRQSALIADVSLKLIQQHQQHLDGTTSSGAAIDADQPQLTGVRVLDKKDEFERRASELDIQATSSSKGSSSGIGREGTPKETQKQDSIDCLVESLSFADKIEQTIVEPIERLQAQTTQPPVALDRRSEVPSGPPTPTEDTLSPAEASRRLFDSGDLLRAGSKSPSSLEAIRDDRSDSVDTIRAELMSLDSPEQPGRFGNNGNSGNIRSSLQIDLSNFQQRPQQQQTPARTSIQTGSGSSLILGPTPITRSYKKVTFTKDGTCVTETGRIYSTQADDGTVRRVERKSKVTHYPGEAAAGSSSSRGDVSEETTHEEVVFEASNSDNGRVWGQQMGSRSSSFARLANKRNLHEMPFERLIMPTRDMFSGNDNDEYDDYNNDQQVFVQTKKQSPFESRRSSYCQQRGRADSGSSCSSGSTDVFDDTFDTWTGAISMFNQNRRMSELHNSLISRALGGSPLPFSESIFSKRGTQSGRPQSGGLTRGSGSTSSAAGPTGAPRCESVEPAMRTRRRGHHSQRRRNGSEQARDGYESDAFDERPASSLGGARGRTFGSSNLFPRPGEVQDTSEGLGDPFDWFQQKQSSLFGVDSLFEDLHMEHERLKQRLSQRHKQLWMGSSPSLQANKQQQYQHNQHNPNNNNNNSNIRPSVPLSAAPTRRNTASLAGDQLPPRQEAQRRSSSRTSLITSQVANLHLRGPTGSSSSMDKARAEGRQHHVASFIELKRSPSWKSRQQQQQQQEEARGSQPNGQAYNVAGGSAGHSSHWNERPTPTSRGSPMSSSGSRLPGGSLHDQTAADSRVQSWLQQSAGNLSISSGSKSSASDTLASSASRSDQAMFMPVQADDSHSGTSYNHNLQQGSYTRLPPPAPSRSPSRQPMQVHRAQQVSSSSSSVVRSTSKQSIEGHHQQLEQRQQLVETRHELQERQQVQQKQQFSSQNLLSKTSSTSTSKLSRDVFSFSRCKSPRPDELFEDQDDWPKPFQQHVANSSHLTEVGRRVSPSTAPTTGANVDGLHWSQMMEAGPGQVVSHGQPAASDGDSLTGSAADLASRSSSSLLDQLRSRGYRSMINQRLQPVADEDSLLAADEQHLVVSSTATTTATSASDQQQTIVANTSRSFVTSSTSTSTTVKMGDVVLRSSSSKSRTDAGNNSYAKPANDLSGLHQQTGKEMQQCNDENNNSLHEQTQLVAAYQGNTADTGQLQRVEANQLASLNGNCKQETTGGDQLGQVASEREQPLQASPAKATDSDGSHPATGGIEKANQDEHEDGEQAGSDLDEDVREAKANIKEYLDRMRETDKFIKSMQAEEENMERQRQELFLFNQLLLSRKLNGIRGGSFGQQSDERLGFQTASVETGSWLESSNRLAARSAPIRSELSAQNGYMLKASNISNNNPTTTMTTTTNSTFSCFSSDLYRPVAAPADPYLEPVQPLYLSAQPSAGFRRHSPTGGAWRRSKSQLGDQFSNSIGISTCSSFVPRSGPSRRPVSANIDPLWADKSPYFVSAPPRHRRSVSQMRTTSSLTADSPYSQGPVMSEYRSAFGAPKRRDSPPTRSTMRSDDLGCHSTAGKSNHNSHQGPQNNNDVHGEDEDEDDDDQMASYRAHSYVARVVPEGGPRGRDLSRRHARYSASKSPQWLAGDHDGNISTSPVSLSPGRRASAAAHRQYSQRRTSLQLSSWSPPSTSLSRASAREVADQLGPDARARSPLVRRRSLASTTDEQRLCQTNDEKRQVAFGGNSRLSELEQRIQANKRRREELLSGATVDGGAVASSALSLAVRDEQPNRVASKETCSDTDEDNATTSTRMESGGRMDEKEARAAVGSPKEPTARYTTGTRTRPSRLESMEARIKRRSYCVRMASPERPARSRPVSGRQSTRPADS